MFVGVARLTLQIPSSSSLKAKRQVVRRVTDRVKARFNVAVAEISDNDLWQKATLALAVVGNDKRHVNEQLDKIIHHIDEMYVAPLVSRQTELLSLGERLRGTQEVEGAPGADFELPFAREDRSLAEAEGMGEWEERHESKAPAKSSPGARAPKKLPLDEARARARRLRNPRDWEKE